MNESLTDSVWKRKGVSVLWDNNILKELVKQQQAISLKEFFNLYDNGWPESSPFINDDMLLIAGLDSALSTLSSQEAEEWMINQVYPKIYDFHQWAEGQYALVFWMPDSKRWRENIENNRYFWIIDGMSKGTEIELGNGIWNGAQKSLRKIESNGSWLGLL